MQSFSERNASLYVQAGLLIQTRARASCVARTWATKALNYVHRGPAEDG